MMMNAVIVHLSALLTDRGVTPGRAAIVVSALGAASLAGRLLTGLLIDRFPAPRVSFVLLAVAAAGTWLLAGAGSLTTGAIAAVMIGFGTGGELDVVPYLLSRYFGLRSLSTLYGLNWTAFGTAGALGPVVMGRMFDTTGSYAETLTVMAATTLAAGRRRYSIRSAVTGSMREARCAGIRLAISAAASSSTPTTVIVAGSLGRVSKSRPCSQRVIANAPPTPITRPIATGHTPPVTTRRIRSQADAPNAARTPSSCVRSAVTYDSTP
jgi:MFS family permease